MMLTDSHIVTKQRTGNILLSLATEHPKLPRLVLPNLCPPYPLLFRDDEVVLLWYFVPTRICVRGLILVLVVLENVHPTHFHLHLESGPWTATTLQSDGESFVICSKSRFISCLALRVQKPPPINNEDEKE